jgi:hypothetical protein
MALGPISGIGAPAPQPSPARDVTPAQRAFFQAALSQAAPVAAVEAPTVRHAAAYAAEPVTPAAPAETPKAAYRPGSLLDIKI